MSHDLWMLGDHLVCRMISVCQVIT